MLLWLISPPLHKISSSFSSQTYHTTNSSLSFPCYLISPYTVSFLLACKHALISPILKNKNLLDPLSSLLLHFSVPLYTRTPLKNLPKLTVTVPTLLFSYVVDMICPCCSTKTTLVKVSNDFGVLNSMVY